MRKEILRCSHLTVGGVNSLKDFNMELYMGESLLLLGNFASGKELVRSVLCGLKQEYEGDIFIDEKRVKNLKAYYDRRFIFYANPEAVLIEGASIAENIFVFSSGRKGILPSRRAMMLRTGRLLAELGLRIRPETRVKELNYYSKLLVCLMKAVLSDSRVILFEYLENELDVADISALKQLLCVEKEKQRAFIILSERMDDISGLADQVLIMDDGKDKWAGNIAEIIGAADKKEKITGKTVIDIETDMNMKAGKFNHRGSITPGQDNDILRICDISHWQIIHEGHILGIVEPNGVSGRMPADYLAELLEREGLGLWYGDERILLPKKKHPVKSGSHGVKVIEVENKDYHLILSRYSLSENLLIPRSVRELGTVVNKRYGEILTEEFYERFGFLKGGSQLYSDAFFWKLAAIYRWERFRPQVMILDNPFLKLDAAEEAALRDYLTELSDRIKLILISHRLTEIRRLTDNVLQIIK